MTQEIIDVIERVEWRNAKSHLMCMCRLYETQSKDTHQFDCMIDLINDFMQQVECSK